MAPEDWSRDEATSAEELEDLALELERPAEAGPPDPVLVLFERLWDKAPYREEPRTVPVGYAVEYATRAALEWAAGSHDAARADARRAAESDRYWRPLSEAMGFDRWQGLQPGEILTLPAAESFRQGERVYLTGLGYAGYRGRYVGKALNGALRGETVRVRVGR